MNSKPLHHMSSRTKVVIIAGGTGGYTVRRALTGREGYLDITHLLGSWDFGGGSRKLLDAGLISLPPGDVAQGILAASMMPEFDKEVFRTRDQHSQSLINMVLAAYEKATNDFHQAVKECSRFFQVQGQVATVTLNQTRLLAKTADGRQLEGEDSIDTYDGPLFDLELRSFHPGPVQVNPEAIVAIEEADFIIIGPGSTYTSIEPNFLVPEFQQVVAHSSAPIIGVANLANDGQTPDWTAYNYGDHYSQVSGRPISYLIANTGQVADWIAEQYLRGEERGSQGIVQLGQPTDLYQYHVIEQDFTSTLGVRQQTYAGGIQRSVLRHMPHRLQGSLLDIFDQNGHNHPW